MSDYTDRNREHWDATAKSYERSAERNWAAPDPSWGVWNIPESELRTLPEDLSGKDTIELGCGTAYFSAILAKLGAKPVGVDPTPAQLATARRMQEETGITFPLVHDTDHRVARKYGVRCWPTTISITAQGQIGQVQFGTAHEHVSPETCHKDELS